ncbi:Uncharacterized protein HSR121_2633 [Halapricum desulfuricans]|uniref:Uncharacterized protein n=1 Tax=Halapricum desulfuricans TaxID=2841257 RepID=A0A897N6Y1_9EURY|nr:Uncharacterized protein HSR121_2633 [Halapricum desulfuricans]
MEAVDSHSDSLESLFDVVPVVIGKMTAQIVTREGSQVATSIDEKLCVADIVFLSEAVKKCRPQKHLISDVRTRASPSLMPRGPSRGG